MNVHHRRAHAHARDLRLEDTLVGAVVVSDVGGGAPHVEGDDLALARGFGRLHRADDAAGRARQDRVLALEMRRFGQAAARLHEHQRHAARLSHHALDVIAQHRREVGVDHGGVAAPDQLHQRADAMAHGNLGKPAFARNLGQAQLMFREPVAVHQDDRDRRDACFARFRQHAASMLLVERRQRVAVGIDALANLGHALIHLRGQCDVAGEDVGPLLVADAQLIGEALRDGQQRAGALALQQRIRGDGRAHLDDFDALVRQRFAGFHADQFADALNDRVAIAFGVLRKQLVGHERTVGTTGDDVGERASAVHPELPAAGACAIRRRGATLVIVIRGHLRRSPTEMDVRPWIPKGIGSMGKWSGLSKGRRTGVEEEIYMTSTRNFYERTCDRKARGTPGGQRRRGAG